MFSVGDDVQFELDDLLGQREAAMERVLKDPAELTKSTVFRGALIELIRMYLEATDPEIKKVYLYYLMGNDFEDTSRMLNIPEGRVVRYFHTFIARFNRFIANQQKEGGIDMDQTSGYIKHLRARKMDERQLANMYNEDMLTTKIMKHFLTQAGMISQYFIYAALTLGTMEFITIIDLI